MINNLFLSVGAMKAGTTWLYENLKSHPEIYFTPEKEIHYFANKVGIENQLSFRNRILKLKQIMTKYHNGNPKYISENVDDIAWYAKYANKSSIDNDWYLSLFDNVGKDKYCSDFSNLYCQMDSVGWKNVKTVARRTKVIYTLRDPMKRLWSHYKFHHKWVGKEDDVISDGIDLFKDTLSKSWFIKNADYAANYENICESLLEEDVLLLYFEDFRNDPQNEMNRITNFLNISDVEVDIANKNKKINATKDYDMPDEWQSYAKDILSPYIAKMKENNIWHNGWKEWEVV